MTFLDGFLGLFRPSAGGEQERFDPHPRPRVIQGGAVAPELCQLVTDGQWDDHARLAADGEVLVQTKMDGIRALYLDGVIVTREGIPLDCAAHCQPSLRRLEELFGEPMMFDCEYVAQDGFNATLAEQRRGAGTGCCWVFDAVPRRDWLRGECTTSTVTRLRRIRQTIADQAYRSDFVGFLDYTMLDLQSAARYVDQIWRAGGEGIVMKSPLAGYTRRRSTAWVRIKQRLVVQQPIIDMVVQDGRARKLQIAGPAGGPPFWVATGWDQRTAEDLANIFVHGGDVPIVVEVELELTTGARRTVRGARFRRGVGVSR